MEQEVILKRINDIDNEMSHIHEIFKSINTINFTEFPEQYQNMTIEAALKFELLICKFRHLIYATLNVSKPELMKKAADVHGIDISYSDGIFNVILPALLPKKKKSLSSEFMSDPLYFALEEYFDKNGFIERFKECVVVFEHIYSEETPRRRIRDYDNIDIKPILDIIATFVMKEDSGKYCDAYNTTGYGKKDGTSISVMSKNRFHEWFSEHKNI